MPYGRIVPSASFAGVRWSQIIPVTLNAPYQQVLWVSDFSQWIALSDDGLGVGRTIRSPDGETWTLNAAALPVGVWRDIDVSPNLEQVIAASLSPGLQFSISLDGGNTWDAGSAPVATANGFNAIVWAGALQLWIAAGPLAAGSSIATSSDGINWTARASAFSASAHTQRAIAFSPDIPRVVTAFTDGTIIYSDDGITWTLAATNAILSDIIWIPELQLFVATAEGTNAFIYTSTDGDTWTQRTMPVSAAWRSVAWSATAGRIIAVNNNAALAVGGSRFASSEDGITWQSEYGPTLDYNMIAEGGTESSFVAISPVAPATGSQVAFSGP